MRLKIISDGTVIGTEVVNVETGESINQVLEARWYADAETGWIKAELVIEDVELEIQTEGTVEHRRIDAAV